MKNYSIKDISSITLGTVQLGIPYGIANKSGQPSDLEAKQILDFAWKNGINSFDTAPAYGESQQRLGHFIKLLKNDPNTNDLPNIISKVPGNLGNTENLKDTYEKMKNSIQLSLDLLNIDYLPYCLLHKASDMKNKNIIDSLIQIKQDGLIEKIGVSIYNPEEVIQFLDTNQMDAIQIPINIFDHRLIKTGLINELKIKKKTVFARSIYLQGLLFLDPQHLPSNLIEAKPYIERLKRISEHHNYSLSEFALAFVRDLPGITSIVLGVDTIKQLKNNIQDFNTKMIEKSIMDEILTEFGTITDNILDPSKWKK